MEEKAKRLEYISVQLSYYSVQMLSSKDVCPVTDDDYDASVLVLVFVFSLVYVFLFVPAVLVSY
jgi:hypothetical protein